MQVLLDRLLCCSLSYFERECLGSNDMKYLLNCCTVVLGRFLAAGHINLNDL